MGCIMAFNVDFLNSKKTKELYNLIKTQYGALLPKKYVFAINNKGKIYAINNNILEVDKNKYHIDRLGLYLGRFSHEGIRCSIEGSQLIGQFASKGILNLEPDQRLDWVTGKDVDLEKSHEDRLVLVKYKEDFIGGGKVRSNKLLNAVSKSRRLRVVNE